MKNCWCNNYEEVEVTGVGVGCYGCYLAGKWGK
jgi:hypothetical protein